MNCNAGGKAGAFKMETINFHFKKLILIKRVCFAVFGEEKLCGYLAEYFLMKMV